MKNTVTLIGKTLLFIFHMIMMWITFLISFAFSVNFLIRFSKYYSLPGHWDKETSVSYGFVAAHLVAVTVSYAVMRCLRVYF